MNYNVISQLLSEGLKSEEVLSLLMKNSPKLASKARKLLGGGWGINEVLDIFSKDSKEITPPSRMNRNASPEDVAKLQAYIGKRRGDKSRDEQAREQLTRFTKGAISLAGSALGSYAIGRALPAAAQAILPSIPNDRQAEQSPTKAPVISSGSAEKEKQNIGGDFKQKFQAESDQIERLRSSGNGPEQIAAYFQKFSPSSFKAVETAYGKSFVDVVKDQILEKKNDNQLEISGENPRQSAPIATAADVIATKQPKQQRNVILPSGEMGEISEVKNGIAKILVNGEQKTRKEEELIHSVLPKNSLSELYTDLISGIEKETGAEVSRNVYWAGYDPKANELVYLPHDGALYVYDNISPKDAELLTSVLSKRKSTNENYIGPWIAGTKSPIGAAMHKLIVKLQKERGGKGNEYKGKFLTIYDALEPAKKEAKKQYEEKKRREKSKAKKPGAG